jgi:sterol desaturase/sphingolipid hydroxylase (fatty acid hydroxylase superfamily)
LLNSIASSLLTISIARLPLGNLPQLELIQTFFPPAMVGIVSILVLDLYMYLWHRVMHTWPLAWRFHRVHHTDRSMNVSTAYRFHPIEVLSSSLPKLVLIWGLGISANIVLTYELIFTVVVALQHSNFALPQSLDRLLAYAIVTPDYHRIHHSQIQSESQSNYGSVFVWWDRIFQSHTADVEPSGLRLGVSDESRDLNVWQLIELPLKTSSKLTPDI